MAEAPPQLDDDVIAKIMERHDLGVELAKQAIALHDCTHPLHMIGAALGFYLAIEGTIRLATSQDKADTIMKILNMAITINIAGGVMKGEVEADHVG